MSCLRFLPVVLLLASPCQAAKTVRLVTDPNLSPDGKTLLFVHRGDIWKVSTGGGQARRVTFHSASDSEPAFSRDGSRIAFVSERTGNRQIFVFNQDQTEPTQLTWHTEGFSLHDWYPDDGQLLVSGNRDHFWRNSQRFLTISSTERSKETLLFNAYGTEGQISPDGSRLLYVREGERWWRKGYHGARSAQVWLFDRNAKKHTKLLDLSTDCFSPLWKPDGSGFFYCGSQEADNGARNLWEHTFQSGQSQQLTHFDDDLVVSPAVSGDGRTIVFSHLFDLYRLRVGKNAKPERIAITISQEDQPADVHRRTLTQATDAAFSDDGLEIAFISGGDLWVMETELREPVRVTSTPEFESDPVFVNDGSEIACVSWRDGEPNLCRIQRAEPSKFWWQNREFTIVGITDDDAVESNVRLSPDGKHIAYVRGRGDLWLRNLESGAAEKLIDSFLTPSYDFSPDGKWIACSLTDANFNTDIWILPTDRSSEPVNISRHPDDETGPLWSTDGKLIAFTGRRSDDEIDIYYVWLAEKDDDLDSRDRKLKKTLEAFTKSRSSKEKSKITPAGGKSETDEKKPAADANQNSEVSPDEDEASGDEKKDAGKSDENKAPEVKIDFADIHRRLKRISIPDSSERVLGWSPEGQKLIFSASIKGVKGTYSVAFPDKLTPKKITERSGSIKGWLKSPERMLWLSDGVPAVQPLTGSETRYEFSARQELSRSDRFRAGFESAWRIMRDWWYDDNFGNHNWNRIRRKYVEASESAGDDTSLARIIHLMLGELNGSHLGFRPGQQLGPKLEGGDDWRPTTAHLGVRFDSRFKGPGLKVLDVIPEGPATDEFSTIEPGEVILSIDGTAVDPAMDLTPLLNGPLQRDIRLKVKAKGKNGGERDLVLRPATYGRVRSLLYRKWQDDNRKLIAKKAGNIGYLHIQGMNWPSFLEFERELYDIGYGKDGLIIDVRDNGGGFTTDHLLTALTQPRHAITVPRGGTAGYPQSRMVYATWHKPIVVLCNQNSYSNAEIFSHAIKGLGRGKLVGVPTAGGVISTGARTVMDLGTIRLPFRGWFVKATGQDMELNGAVPHVIVQPRPGEIPSGKDRQLNKAIQVLRKEIESWKANAQPPLIKATERVK